MTHGTTTTTTTKAKTILWVDIQPKKESWPPQKRGPLRRGPTGATKMLSVLKFVAIMSVLGFFLITLEASLDQLDRECAEAGGVRVAGVCLAVMVIETPK